MDTGLLFDAVVLYNNRYIRDSADHWRGIAWLRYGASGRNRPISCLADTVAHGLLVDREYSCLLGYCLGWDDILLLRNQRSSVMIAYTRKQNRNTSPKPIDPCCRTTRRCSR